MRFKLLLGNILCGAILAGLGFGLGSQCRPVSVAPRFNPPVQNAVLHFEPASTGLAAEIPPPNREFF